MMERLDSDMAQIIRARFMHQHKDKAVYEREILLDTPSINRYYGKPTTYLEFDMPILLSEEPEWVFKLAHSDRDTLVTRRSLRFVDADGAILYELSKHPLKATICITGRGLDIFHISCVVDKDEVKELSKIFFK